MELKKAFSQFGIQASTGKPAKKPSTRVFTRRGQKREVALEDGDFSESGATVFTRGDWSKNVAGRIADIKNSGGKVGVKMRPWVVARPALKAIASWLEDKSLTKFDVASGFESNEFAVQVHKDRLQEVRTQLMKAFKMRKRSDGVSVADSSGQVSIYLTVAAAAVPRRLIFEVRY